MLNSKNTIAIPPGATIREQLENRKMSQKEFSTRMGLSEKHISRLINGKVELTTDVSLRLESVLGLPAKFWINMESIYREKLARVELELSMEKDMEIAARFPYPKLASLNWLPATRKINEKVVNLRSFFEVAELGLLDSLKMPGIAYRVNGETETSNFSLAAWAQKAKLEARLYRPEPINIKKLSESLDNIRGLTILPPEEFCTKLQDIFLSCGVVIVFLPHINGSFLHGATFCDGNHIVLGLTVRGKDSDRFWFSLFHEIFHILAGHIFSDSNTSEADEKNADQFSKDTLINPKDYAEFVKRQSFSKHDITIFAKKLNLSPGIVLGRLQKENLVPYSHFRELKEQYTIY